MFVQEVRGLTVRGSKSDRPRGESGPYSQRIVGRVGVEVSVLGLVSTLYPLWTIGSGGLGRVLPFSRGHPERKEEIGVVGKTKQFIWRKTVCLHGEGFEGLGQRSEHFGPEGYGECPSEGTCRGGSRRRGYDLTQGNEIDLGRIDLTRTFSPLR